ncbi:MAG: aryl-sulfate sulfotransferase [Myxococcales bacterium]|nr:aryl-sulfate sulfotransferase [Myxococcales bacterium]
MPAPRSASLLALVTAAALALAPACAGGGPETTETSATSTTGGGETDTGSTGEPAPPAAYFLYAPLLETETYLVDRDLAVVHSWTSATRPGSAALLLPGGELLRAGLAGNDFAFAGVGGLLERQSWAGDPLSELVYSDETHRQHHDFLVLPSGNILTIAWEYKSPEEAQAAGRDPATIDMSRGLWPDSVVELDPASGAVVWEWHVWDHIIQDRDPMAPAFGVVADHPELIDLNFIDDYGELYFDWNHINGLDYHPELDQIVLSPLRFSEIWIIDHSTTSAEAASHSGGEAGRGGDLLYRWGNPSAYQAAPLESRHLYHQHDPRWIPPGYPGAGNLTIFNNGLPDEHEESTVVEITPPLAPDGTYTREGAAWGPELPVWEYIADPPESFFSAVVGSAQRLPDGTTLINQGEKGRFFIVDEGGTIVWEKSHGQGVFRVDGFTADDPALAGLGLPGGG